MSQTPIDLSKGHVRAQLIWKSLLILVAATAICIPIAFVSLGFLMRFWVHGD